MAWTEVFARWDVEEGVLADEVILGDDSCTHGAGTRALRDLPELKHTCESQEVRAAARLLEELLRIQDLVDAGDARGLLARPGRSLLAGGSGVVQAVRRAQLALLESNPLIFQALVRDAVGLEDGEALVRSGREVLVALGPFMAHHARVLRAWYGEVGGEDSFAAVPHPMATVMVRTRRVRAEMTAELRDGDGDLMDTLVVLLEDRRRGSSSSTLEEVLEVARAL